MQACLCLTRVRLRPWRIRTRSSARTPALLTPWRSAAHHRLNPAVPRASTIPLLANPDAYGRPPHAAAHLSAANPFHHTSSCRRRMPVPMRENGSIAPMANPTYKGEPPYTGAWADCAYDPETPGYIHHPGTRLQQALLWASRRDPRARKARARTRARAYTRTVSCRAPFLTRRPFRTHSARRATFRRQSGVRRARQGAAPLCEGCCACNSENVWSGADVVAEKLAEQQAAAAAANGRRRRRRRAAAQTSETHESFRYASARALLSRGDRGHTRGGGVGTVRGTRARRRRGAPPRRSLDAARSESQGRTMCSHGPHL